MKEFCTHAGFSPSEGENCLTRNQPIPEELRRYMDKSDARIDLKINQTRIYMSLNPGFVRIERRRQEAEETELNLHRPRFCRNPLSQESGMGLSTDTALLDGLSLELTGGKILNRKKRKICLDSLKPGCYDCGFKIR